MKTITATEANQRFPDLLRRVQAGESFTVTSHGRPVAKVGPVDSELKKQSAEEFVAYLKSLPRREPMPWTRDELYD